MINGGIESLFSYHKKNGRQSWATGVILPCSIKLMLTRTPSSCVFDSRRSLVCMPLMGEALMGESIFL